MPSAADNCWRLSADCSHWAKESRDNDARLAFRQMAMAWAGLAFSQDFVMATDQQVGLTSSESSEDAPVENIASSDVENEQISPPGPSWLSGRREKPERTTQSSERDGAKISLPNQWGGRSQASLELERGQGSGGRIGRPNRARGAPGASLLSDLRVTASRLLRLRRNAGVTAQPSAATPFQPVRSRQATVSLMQRLIAWDRQSWSVLAAPS
jgi:hypothetical protein